MTETKEQELLPCCHCGGQGVEQDINSDNDSAIVYGVCCDNCTANVGVYGTREQARAAWNRRAVPDMQWSAEVPWTVGDYWLYCPGWIFCQDTELTKKPMVVHITEANGGSFLFLNFPQNNEWSEQLYNFTCRNPNALWLPISPPPMPERREP